MKPLLQSAAADHPLTDGTPRLFGAHISALSKAELVASMTGAPLIGGDLRLLVTMNLDHVVRLQSHPLFAKAYGRAWAVTLDGAPVWLYSRLRGLRISRCTGADLTVDLVAGLRADLHRPFFVVSSENTGELLISKLRSQGFTEGTAAFASPQPGFETDAAASAKLLQAISAHRATHLIFGLGAPKSEIWIDQHRAALGPLYALAVGSAPDFLVGSARRAPKLLQNVGLEWAWRVAHDRRRLFKRYFVDSWGFVPAVLRDLGLLPAPTPAPPLAGKEP